MAVRDLSRWNRAGLTRVDYVDGNAVTFLADLRDALAEAFPDLALPPAPPEDAAPAEQLQALAALYADDRHDLFWQFHRSLARACHVLAGYIDATANESWIGTATQWESLRRLVAMLDYAPRPPASAETPLVIEAAADGLLEAGFGVKYSPEDGSPPVVFETLADIELRAELNTLWPTDHDRNPEPLRGRRLVVEGEFTDLVVGDPLVLENTRTEERVALRIAAVQAGSDRTRITVHPGIPPGFVTGDTRVHLQPRERLQVKGPVTTGAEIGSTLRLQEPPDDITAGDLLAIGSPGHKPVFLYVKKVLADGLRFPAPVGELDLRTARIGKAEELPVSFHVLRKVAGGQAAAGDALGVFYLAGDWRRLKGRWLARRRHNGDTRKPLPVFRVVAAHYDPADAEQPRFAAGYTRIVLAVNSATLRQAGLDASAFRNTQAFLMAPESPGPWRPDPWVEQSRAGEPANRLQTEKARKLSPGDFVVLQRGNQQAWARLEQVDTNGESVLHVDRWQHRGGGPFYLAGTRLIGGFRTVARPVDWNRNETPLQGSRIALAALPESLLAGREVMVTTDADALHTRIVAIDRERATITLEDPLPRRTPTSDVAIWGNVVRAGHGESRPEKVLGSGTGTPDAAYTFDADEVAFVSDPTRESGVRAAVELRVDGRIWKAVDSFRDAGPTDAVYRTRMTEDGQIRILFGDGVHGRVVPPGRNNLRVAWRQGVGPAGNLPAGRLETPLRRHYLVAGVRQFMAAGGGAAMESAAELREAAPATVMTLARAVSLRDFAMLARSHSSVWQARAFPVRAAHARNEAVRVVVVPAHGADLTATLQQDLQTWLQAHALPGVQVDVVSFESVRVRLSMTVYIDTSAWEAGVVAEAVRAALLTAFGLDRRRLGQPLYRSELFAVIENVTGVLHSEVRMSLAPDSAPPARTVASEDGSLRLIDPGPTRCAWLDSSLAVEDLTVEAWTDG